MKNSLKTWSAEGFGCMQMNLKKVEIHSLDIQEENGTIVQAYNIKRKEQC